MDTGEKFLNFNDADYWQIAGGDDERKYQYLDYNVWQ